MNNLDLSLESLCKLLDELKLKSFVNLMQSELPELKSTEQNVLLNYLHRWVLAETTERQAALIQSRIRNARFRNLQTIDAFDFSYNKSTQALKQQYLKLLQRVSKEHLPSAIFAGSAGLGKTHLARSLGYAACQKSLSTLFITAAQMVNKLAQAQSTLTLEIELGKYRKPQVLIIDELGYVQMDPQASNLFFQVISSRHDVRLGTIATTNLPFGKWNQIFANDAIAHAIVDRLVADAEVFYLEGTSYREHQRQQKNHSKKD